MSSASPVWFITGCSAGFGKQLALLVLRAGHRVIASSRNPSKTPELVSEVQNLGGKWITLDVSAGNVEEVMAESLNIYGGIDVLVNNAGYSLLGALEDFSIEESREQMEVNFFGPLRTTKAVLPSMRERRSGTIVNIGSIAGFDAQPACSLYAASKHALEGQSEALYREMAPFNVNVLLVEPGTFRTNFLDAYVAPAKERTSAYKGTPVNSVMDRLAASNGNQRGDAEKGCQRIFDVVTRTGLARDLKKQHLRLPLGEDAAIRIKMKLDTITDTLEELRPLWSTTDHDGWKSQ